MMGQAKQQLTIRDGIREHIGHFPAREREGGENELWHVPYTQRQQHYFKIKKKQNDQKLIKQCEIMHAPRKR